MRLGGRDASSSTYDRGDRVVTRLVDPLGIVLKAGTWYLVAAHEGQLRTYRVSRVRDVRATEARYERPAGFDLSTYWSESIAAYEREAPRIEVTLRARRGAARWLEDVIDAPSLAAGTELPDPEPDAWRTIRADAGLAARGRGPAARPRRRGRGARPPELRAEIAALATEAAARYAPSPATARPA